MFAILLASIFRTGYCLESHHFTSRYRGSIHLISNRRKKSISSRTGMTTPSYVKSPSMPLNPIADHLQPNFFVENSELPVRIARWYPQLCSLTRKKSMLIPDGCFLLLYLHSPGNSLPLSDFHLYSTVGSPNAINPISYGFGIRTISMSPIVSLPRLILPAI